MTDALQYVILLLIACLGAWLFWSWRKQEEFAKRQIQHICKQASLQFLDVARHSGKVSFKHGLQWQAEFVFGFSSDGETRYEGVVTLLNFHLKDYQLPPHRLPPEESF